MQCWVFVVTLRKGQSHTEPAAATASISCPFPSQMGFRLNHPQNFIHYSAHFAAEVRKKKEKKMGDILHFIHSVGARSSTDMNESSVRRLLEKQHFLRRQLQDL